MKLDWNITFYRCGTDYRSFTNKYEYSIYQDLDLPSVHVQIINRELEYTEYNRSHFKGLQEAFTFCENYE